MRTFKCAVLVPGREKLGEKGNLVDETCCIFIEISLHGARLLALKLLMVP